MVLRKQEYGDDNNIMEVLKWFSRLTFMRIFSCHKPSVGRAASANTYIAYEKLSSPNCANCPDCPEDAIQVFIM